MTFANRLLDHQGRPIQLGAEICRGGEGAIYHVPSIPDIVAKLYHAPPSVEKADKLAWMVKNKTDALLRVAAWPITTLHEQHGATRGFLMPRIAGYKEIHLLYSLHSRRKEFSKADWAFMIQVAMNCAAAFAAIHEQGHLVADVNQKNVLVSPQDATVRLLDCDSFQVQVNGKALVCEVGVPEYTPPEIQGLNFRTVARTENHDRFGLAVLIFHLLFVGRHPFSGRFLGKGDMPLDQAIRELRFVYSQAAAAKQMAAPPFSLSPEVLPARHRDLFELAFSNVGVSGGRPSAMDWFRHLAELGKQLRTCTVDTTHRFPNQIAECPWCKIQGLGGPAFFISLLLDFQCGPADLVQLWAQLDSLQLPAPALHPIHQGSTAPSVPLPAPAATAKDRVRWSAAGVSVALLSAATGLLIFLVFSSPLAATLALFSLFCALPFRAWGWWLNRRSAYGRELTQRRLAFNQAREALKGSEVAWQKRGGAAPRLLQEGRGRMEKLRMEYLELRTAYDADWRRLQEHKEEAQRRDFLESQLIDAHKIDKIKDGRKAVLRGEGIESAYDVLNGDLDAVPGFGPILRQALMEWAQRVAAGFRFDPAKNVPESERQALVWKYQQQKNILKGRMERTLSELCTQLDQARDLTLESSQNIARARQELDQAWANLRAA